MSWFRESQRSWLEAFCIRVLKKGEIPKHVAFIMDGNRRYATKVGLHKVQGHALGFEKLSETLGWCLDLGIIEVTVYTFSIENFKRSEEEVTCLMDLARDKFKELLEEKDKLDRYGVHIRIFGDLSLLPVDLQKLVAEAILYTCENTKTYLNVCLAYTSREEITNAVKEMANGVITGKLQPCDVTEDLMNNCIYSANATNPDVVVRTSGEVRLSDFLLWQSSYSLLAFLRVLWPEFSIWHLFFAVLYYQRYFKALKNVQIRHNEENYKQGNEDEIIAAKLEYKKIHNITETDDISETDLVEQRKLMAQRRKSFIVYLQNKRLLNLENMKEGCTKQSKPHIG